MGLQSSPGGIDQVAQERRVKANKKRQFYSLYGHSVSKF